MDPTACTLLAKGKKLVRFSTLLSEMLIVFSDGNIRYYEYENDKFEFLSEYKSPDPQRGIAFLPRRGINVGVQNVERKERRKKKETFKTQEANLELKVHENEVMRAYKTVNDAYIEPISFTVPRRAENFQADIFPPATGTKSAVGAQEWLNGKTGIPAKIDLESIYDGGAPKEIPSDYKPATQSTTAPTLPPSPTFIKAEEQPKKEEPRPASFNARGPPPSMKDQKSSISLMANKYQDNEEDDEEEGEDVDDTSSFEEVSRPIPRRTARAEPRPTSMHVPAPEPVKPASPAATPTPNRASPSGPSVGAEVSLNDIKQLLENQTRVITAQNDKINRLVNEVESLKKRVNASGSRDQSERIRQLELELEEARS